MHNLDTIAFLQPLGGMRTARHDALVQFDGDAALGISTVREQISDGGLRGQCLLRAVEQDIHRPHCNRRFATVRSEQCWIAQKNRPAMVRVDSCSHRWSRYLAILLFFLVFAFLTLLLLA